LKRDGFVQVQQWINFFDVFWHTRLSMLGTLLDSQAPTGKKK
jgi:hypothetical protein